MTELNEEVNSCVIQANRVTVQPKDMKLAVKLRCDEEKMRNNIEWKN